VKEAQQITRLGKGPAIKVMDGRAGSGLITNPYIKNKLVEVAREEGIPYQLEVLSGGTTDASIIALNREGVPAGVVSIPTRYIHSPVELLNLDDCCNAVRLTRRFLEKIDYDWVKSIKEEVLK